MNDEKQNYTGEKIYAHPFYILTIFLPIYALSIIVFYALIGLVFPPTLLHYLLLGAWTVVTILYLVFANRLNYYELTKRELIHYRNKNQMRYVYKDIWYIDEHYSANKKSIRFFTNQGDERYIIHDKKRIIYTELLKRCPNLLTKEAYLTKFPKLKM